MEFWDSSRRKFRKMIFRTGIAIIIISSVFGLVESNFSTQANSSPRVNDNQQETLVQGNRYFSQEEMAAFQPESESIAQLVKGESGLPSSSSRPGGSPQMSGSTGAPKSVPKTTGVGANPYRTAPKATNPVQADQPRNVGAGNQVANPGKGGPGKPGSSGGSDYDDSDKTSLSQSKELKKEIKSYEFAVNQNQNQQCRPKKVVVKFESDSRLGKEAKTALKDQEAGKKYKAAVKKLERGQPPKSIGIRGKYLGNGKGYIRTGNVRIYFEEFHDEVHILGIARKDTNIAKVLGLLKEIYDLDINLHD